jgi:predicted metal-dependent hydrolase
MNIDYGITTSTRARQLRISIYPNGKVMVTRPRRVAMADAERFVRDKNNWILRKLEAIKNRKRIPLDQNFMARKQALGFVRSRVEHYNEHYKFDVGQISTKDHKSLWGSCTSRRNLNFNIRIVQLPQHQADYIIVHELCHLREFNHSPKFWKLVAQTVPDYKCIRLELKDYTFD